jgi:hypothetical protein
MLLVVAHRSRLLAAISTSPAATLTLQAGVCFWPRPTVGTVIWLSAGRLAAAVLPTSGDTYATKKFDEPIAHMRAVLVREFQRRLRSQKPLDIVRPRPDAVDLRPGNTPEFGWRRTPVVVVGFALLIEATIASIPASDGCPNRPRRKVVKGIYKGLAAGFGA